MNGDLFCLCFSCLLLVKQILVSLLSELLFLLIVMCLGNNARMVFCIYVYVTKICLVSCRWQSIHFNHHINGFISCAKKASVKPLWCLIG